MTLVAVNHHYVGMPAMPHLGIHGMGEAEFRRHLEALGREVEFVSLAQVSAAVAGGGTLPDAACLITFDDGLRCQVEKALPILDDLGIPAAFFIVAGPLRDGRATAVHKFHYLRAGLGSERVWDGLADMAARGGIEKRFLDIDEDDAREAHRYDDDATARLKYCLNYVLPVDVLDALAGALLAELGTDETAFVREFYMDAGMIEVLGRRGMVGSHAVTHRPLARLDDDSLNAELRDSRRFLEDATGAKIAAISYPLGNRDAVDRRVADAAASVGYRCGWSMERAVNATLDDPLLLARIDAKDVDELSSLTGRRRYLTEAAA